MKLNTLLLTPDSANQPIHPDPDLGIRTYSANPVKWIEPHNSIITQSLNILCSFARKTLHGGTFSLTLPGCNLDPPSRERVGLNPLHDGHVSLESRLEGEGVEVVRQFIIRMRTLNNCSRLRLAG